MTEQRPWAIRLTVLASEAELEAIVERIGAAICGAADRPGPCANPWSIESTQVDDLDDPERSTWLPSVDELLDQRRAQREAVTGP